MKRPRITSAEDIAKAHKPADVKREIGDPTLADVEGIDKHFLSVVRNVLIQAIRPEANIVIHDPVDFMLTKPEKISHGKLHAIDAGTNSSWIININPSTFSDEDATRVIGGHTVHNFDGEPMSVLLDYLAKTFSSDRLPGMNSFMYNLKNQAGVRAYLEDKEPGHALIFSGITFRALGDWQTLCLYLNEDDQLVPGCIHLWEEFTDNMTFAWFDVDTKKPK